MAISPISAFSNYSYLFNITSQDEKAEQKDKLNLLMSQYNLVSTDDYDKDIERLRAAIIQEQIERASQEQEKSQETEGYEERRGGNGGGGHRNGGGGNRGPRREGGNGGGGNRGPRREGGNGGGGNRGPRRDY